MKPVGFSLCFGRSLRKDRGPQGLKMVKMMLILVASLVFVVTNTKGQSTNLACGTHSLDPGSYTFSSTNYPANYDDSESCKWDLKANTGSKINGMCTDFDVEYVSNCGRDSLWIKNEDGAEKLNSIGYCGSDVPLPITFGYGKSTRVVAHFRSNAAVNKKGFTCQFTVSVENDCNCTKTNPTPTTTSGVYLASPPSQFPWLAAIKFTETSNPVYNGAIVSTNYVLTQFNIYLDGYVGLSGNTINHKYSFVNMVRNFDLNLALIKVDNPMTFASGVGRINLANPSTDYFNKAVTAVGYQLNGWLTGLSYSAVQTGADQNFCTNDYQSAVSHHGIYKQKGICTSTITICKLDNGYSLLFYHNPSTNCDELLGTFLKRLCLPFTHGGGYINIANSDVNTWVKSIIETDTPCAGA